jgi:hypothetical protein
VCSGVQSLPPDRSFSLRRAEEILCNSRSASPGPAVRSASFTEATKPPYRSPISSTPAGMTPKCLMGLVHALVPTRYSEARRNRRHSTALGSPIKPPLPPVGPETDGRFCCFVASLPLAGADKKGFVPSKRGNLFPPSRCSEKKSVVGRVRREQG